MSYRATPMPEAPPPVFNVKKVPSRSARRKKAKKIWLRSIKARREFVEEQEADFKQLGKTMNYRATPMPEAPPPVFNVTKVPSRSARRKKAKRIWYQLLRLIKERKEFLEGEQEENSKQLSKTMNFGGSPMSSFNQKGHPSIIKIKKEVMEEQESDFKQHKKAMNSGGSPVSSFNQKGPSFIVKVKKEFLEDEQEENSKQLSKTMNFGGSPMSSFNQKGHPSIIKIKKEVMEEKESDFKQHKKAMNSGGSPVSSFNQKGPPFIVKVKKEYEEEQEAYFEQLGKTMNFRATPMPSFNPEGPPPVLKVKKMTSKSARGKKARRRWHRTLSSNKERKKEEEAALKQLAMNINLRTTPMSIFYQEDHRSIAEEGITFRSNVGHVKQ